MTDLADRLREIEQNPAPELWEEIESRAQGQDLGERFDVRHRVIAGLVATIVSLAAFAFLFAAFRPSPNRVPTDVTSEPMRIEVRTRPDGSNLRITARFEGEEIELVGIETPGPDLEYPRSGPVTLPTGTPVVVDAPDGVKVSLFELAPAQGMFVVDRGACLEPGALRALPGPAETAFFIYIEGEGFSAGQAFTAVTTGQTFEHPSAIDPRATTDGDDLGLAACGVPHLLTSASGPSGDQALLRGTIVVESGCLAVSNGPDSNVFVVWPQGYSLDAVDGEVWLVDDAGTAIARIGDEVQMGGGITGLSDAGDDVVGGIPGPCQVGGPDSYWFAGTPELVTSIATSHAANAEPVRIDGVPFPVCRPMSIPGRFAGGSDTAWIFERAVDEDCEGDEGFQYVAIGSSDAATAMSGRVQSGLDSVALWPYAAVDIDRDGFDEIAVGVEGSEADRRATIILFRLGRLTGLNGVGVGLEEVSLSCGTVCVQGPSRIELGEYPGTHLGAGCENYGQLRDGIVLWSVRQGTALLQGRLWTMQGSELRATDRTFELEGEASASLPDGTIELCGSPVHWPSDFPTYPMSNIGSS